VSAVDVLTRPTVVDALERAADAGLARTALDRIVDAHGDAAVEVLDDERSLDALVAVACASRSLVSALVGDAGLLEVVRDE
jgi:hypothetical protein